MILWLSACMTFDPFVFNATQVDAYALDFGEVPPHLVEEVTFESLDGTLLYGVWAHQPVASPPLLFLHGNTGNIDTYANYVEYYWSWGTYDVFAVDYRGFGRSEGVPDADVLNLDGVAAAEYVSSIAGVVPEKVPWLTVSLGSAVAVHANAEVGAKVVVLDSMFASADAVLDDSSGLDLPLGWFIEDPIYDNVAWIGEMQDPVLLIHGRDDDFIPPDHVEALYEAAPSPKSLWRPAGVDHAEAIEVEPELYRVVVEDWILRAP
ncbi:MAG: alpha/beta hydrolase [Myxococcota bacterium]